MTKAKRRVDVIKTLLNDALKANLPLMLPQAPTLYRTVTFMAQVT